MALVAVANYTISLLHWFNMVQPYQLQDFVQQYHAESCLPFIELTETAKGNLGSSAVYVHIETWPIGRAVFAKSQAAPYTSHTEVSAEIFLSDSDSSCSDTSELSWCNSCRRLSKKTLQLGAWTTM